MSEDLVGDLMELLGKDNFFRLCEAYAGMHQFVPRGPSWSDMPSKVGDEIARLLSRSYGGNYVRVPLARTFRARRYRDAGMSNRDFAMRPGWTENAVERSATSAIHGS